MEIKSPRRILALGPRDSGVLTLLKSLTGSAPDPRTVLSENAESEPAGDNAAIATTTAGLIHSLRLDTKYYSATIPIWIDEAASTSAWKSDFLQAEAAEVIAAVGAWIVVFRRQATSKGDASNSRDAFDVSEAVQLMRAVKEVVENANYVNGLFESPACFVVGMPVDGGSSQAGTRPSSSGSKRTVWLDEQMLSWDEWEEMCLDEGFEYIDGDVTSTERDANRELKGLLRLREALEANEWAGDEVEGDDDAFGLDTGLSDDTDETLGFRLERSQMEREFVGLKLAMTEGGENDMDDEEEDPDEALQVEELERMLIRVNAVRDMNAHLPEDQRRRLAAKTVNDIMRTL